MASDQRRFRLLTPPEQSVYSGLNQQCSGVNVNVGLEQERIAWGYARNVLVGYA